MKLAAFLLITISLCIGVIGAVTAYLPPLSLADERLIGLTLNAPAGNTSADLRAPKPIAGKGTTLTSELLTALRGAGVERVKVKEFSFGRWPEWWMFVLGCGGLGAGALMVRSMRRRAASVASMEAGAGGVTRLSPEQTLEALQAEVDALRGRLRTTGTEEERLGLMLAEIAKMQQTHIAAFIGARPELTARLGMGGYARLMDSFASAERSINRAWSAAADGVEAEAAVCLDDASGLLAESRGRL